MVSYEIKDLDFTYPLNKTKSLNNINLTIHRGEFVVICGKSGCGKSTLLKHLKPVLTPHGIKTGDIFFEEKDINEYDLQSQASKIGYVMQNPDNQIVTDKVWHELAFGLESLGFDHHTIRLRVAEMASFFGITDWFMKNVTELSGGQKQLLSLASIMAMQPSVLILDEPTSQLDPIAATEFLETVKKINQELGITIILSEHRLEEVLPMADKVVVLDKGEIIANGSPIKICNNLKISKNDMFIAMPSAMQIYAEINQNFNCPITVRDGRNYLDGLLANKKIVQYPKKKQCFDGESIISIKNVWFRYEKHGNDIIKDLCMDVKKSTLHAIVGANGTGKTTALSLISRLNLPYRGKILINNKNINHYKNHELYESNIGVLPQNPQALFVKNTVKLDLMEMLSKNNLSLVEKEKKVKDISQLVEIDHLLNNHPYDLSGGEQQRAALAKVLLLNPQILLLDEPTKGLDACFKVKLAEILTKLKQNGVTILMVSHDIEFCAKYADVCSMFFDGSIITTKSANEFFSGNSFYTTAANRISRHIFDNTVTNQEVIEACKITLNQPND